MTSMRMVIWTRIPLETLINNIAFTKMWCTECIAFIIFIFVKIWFYNKWQSLCLVPGSVKDKKKNEKKKYFLKVRLSQIMHFKSQKYTVDHLLVYYKNQLSEFIFKEIMETRWFYIVNVWIHLQYIFIKVIWLIFIFFSFIIFLLLQKHGKNTCARSTIHGSWEDYAEIVEEEFY